ncbi:MAG: hypothetical protein OIN87_05525 [Candidatus Methanoperedens sp.]|nr:hypothetical protein [Candidatus Methanoperedens sp.]
MYKQTLGIGIILIILLSMGTVYAKEIENNGKGGGCRGNINVPTYEYLSSSTSTNRNVVTYILNTFSGAPGDARVIGYCVYPEPVFTGETKDLIPLELTAIWHPNKKDYFGFERGNGGKEILIDGTKGIEVGRADYKSFDKIPISEDILFHIIDGKECGLNADGSADSCWRKAITPIPPVPELSPIIMMSAGLMGIALILKKYRSN